MDAASITGWLSQIGGRRLRDLFDEGPEHAANWVRVLAHEGVAAAQTCYGRLLLEGTGVSKDSCDALRWFERAAALDDLDAINMVGRCLENGWGCAIDLRGAAAAFHRAADAGHAWAQYNLGHLYLDGCGVPRNAESAYQYYLSAASQGHVRAMNLVGRCCEEGWGTARDRQAAADWYRRSAEGDYFRGQFNWASVLLSSQRFDAAAAWFERAASSGTPAVRAAVLRLASLPGSPPQLVAMASRLNADGACA